MIRCVVVDTVRYMPSRGKGTIGTHGVEHLLCTSNHWALLCRKSVENVGCIVNGDRNAKTFTVVLTPEDQ